MKRSSLPIPVLFLGFALSPARLVSEEPSAHVIRLEGDVQYTHDPSIIKDGDTWYLFSTNNGPERAGELPIRCSHDLHHWKRCGYVFATLPEWIKKESPQTRDLWAPDLSYFNR